MATRLLPPGEQLIDANGHPYSGAKLYTYEAGTSTPKPTFSDAGLTIPNANPVLADSAGRWGDIFAGIGDYRLIATSSTDVTVWTADPVSGATGSAAAGGASFRNVLINGDFSIDQRQATSVANDTYCLDRWYVLTNTGSVTIAQQQLQLAGISSNIRLTQPDVTPKRMGIAQIVEATNCRFLRDSDAVQSGWVRTSISTPVRYAILSWTGTANAVTSDVVLDWTSTSYTAGGFFLAANLTVQKVGSLTPSAGVWTPIPEITSVMSGSLQNAIIFIWTENTVAQNVTLSIGNIQFEAGDTATTFEYVGATMQELRCYRYYQKSFNRVTAPAQSVEPSLASRFTQAVAASTVQYGNRIDLAVPIWKETYTVTLFNPEAANNKVRNLTVSADCSTTGIGAFGNHKFTIDATAPAGSSAGDVLAVHWTVEAEL